MRKVKLIEGEILTPLWLPVAGIFVSDFKSNQNFTRCPERDAAKGVMK